jgi:hypothetical protein
LCERENLTDDYLDELLAVRAKPAIKDGHLRRNWDHEGRKHDYFDVSMMYLVLEDVAISTLELSEFRQRKAEVLFREDMAAANEVDDNVDMETREDGGFVQNWR